MPSPSPPPRRRGAGPLRMGVYVLVAIAVTAGIAVSVRSGLSFIVDSDSPVAGRKGMWIGLVAMGIVLTGVTLRTFLRSRR